VTDLSKLMIGMRPDVETFLLDSNRHAISQVAQALAKRPSVAAMHIVAHSRAGEVSFASDPLSLETIDAHGDDLSAIGRALGPDGGLALIMFEGRTPIVGPKDEVLSKVLHQAPAPAPGSRAALTDGQDGVR
jgi:Domain of unknown function (DUF4347)